MSSFWILLALLTCVATALVVWPLVKRRDTARARSADDEARRVGVYRDRRQEIERERDAGRLTAEEAARALDELVAEAARLLPGGSADAATDAVPRSPRQPATLPWVVISALLVPLAAVGIYAMIGSPAIIGLDSATLRGELSPQRLEQAVAELSERVGKTPQDGEAWAMLAEARRLRNELEPAAEAYAQATRLLPGNARLLADYAETLVLVGNGNFAGRPLQLLTQALEADPTDGKAIALMGAAQYRLGNLDEALRYLRLLASSLPQGSDEAARLSEAIARIEGERTSTGNPPTAPSLAGDARPAAPATRGSDSPAAAAATVSGVISIDEKLRATVPSGAVLFIVARDPDGPRIPIAALRKPVDRWPVAFELGEAQTMDPSRPLSKAARIVVEARISASGDAMRHSGDPFGISQAQPPGARDVAVRIDQQAP